MKMNYDDFTKYVKENLFSGTGISVSYDKIHKMNGEQLCAVIGDDNVRPNINIQTIYDDYLESELSEYDIVKKWENILSEALNDGKAKTFEEMDYDYIFHNNVIPILVGAEAYKGKEIISEDYKGMKIIFKAVVSDIDNTEASIVITPEILENFNISVDEMKAQAMRNLEKQEFFCNSLANMLPFELGEEDNSTFVISTKQNAMGANVLLMPEKLAEFSHKYMNSADFVILPSSIHEVLCLPGISDDFDYLKGLVKEINSNPLLLKEEEILSNDIFYFSMESKEITIL